MDNHKLMVPVMSVNQGDEVARNVRFEIVLSDVSYSSPEFPAIAINEVAEHTFAIDLADSPYDQRVIPIITHYSDANLYPFSAISYATLRSPSGSTSKVVAHLTKPVFQKKGVISIRLRSAGGSNRPISLRMIGPREISIEPNAMELELPASGSTNLFFHVENFSALPNSTYTILAIVSEILNNTTIESPFITQVSILRAQDVLWMRIRNPVTGLLIVLALALVIRFLRRRKV